MNAAPSPARDARTRSQAAAVALGLAALFAALLPLLLVAVLSSVELFAVLVAPFLIRVGASAREPISAGLHVAAVVVGALLLATLVLRAVSRARRDRGSKSAGWLLRYPWIVGGLLILAIADALVIVGPDAPDGFAAGSLFAAAAFLNVTALWALGTLVRWLFRSAWSVSRRSAFAAGAITAGALAAAAVIGNAELGLIAATASKARSLPSASLDLVGNAHNVVLDEGAQLAPLLGISTRDLPQAAAEAGVSAQAAAFSPVFDACARDLLEEQGCHRAVEQWRRVLGRKPYSAHTEDIILESVYLTCRERRDDYCPYFYRVTQHLIGRMARGARRECEWPGTSDPACPMPNPEEQLAVEELARYAEQVLCRLPSSDQEILRTLVECDGDYQTVCGRLGITYAAARKRVQRARERFAEYARKCGPGSPAGFANYP